MADLLQGEYGQDIQLGVQANAAEVGAGYRQKTQSLDGPIRSQPDCAGDVRKRAWMAIRLLLWWTAYVVLAFASVQMALNGLETEQTGSPEGIVLSLCKQAALDVPAYCLRDGPPPMVVWNARALRCRHAQRNTGVLFHLAVAAIILKGVYRIWVFTKEASPRVFYRKLHLHN